jgi:phosphatidate cytidylyltransferase
LTMLAQRVITALVLLALLLPALFASAPWPFALLTLVLIAAAGWEWARLNGGASLACVAFGAVLACACAAALAAGWTTSAPALIWWIATLVWVLGGAWALKAGPAGWPALPLSGRWALGFLALWTAWLALASARVVGINFILSVFCLVWAADIAAYFGGRTFGKRKLALSISPGKSWEGVWSGMLGVMLLAFAWVAFDRSGRIDSGSLYTRLLDAHGAMALVFVLIFLSAMSVVGDLVESLVKRSAGAKDSSGLLPGHGGVLDRVDALLPVFPLALAMISLK